ncbi:unnamed protein product, partial [Porites lobata]
ETEEDEVSLNDILETSISNFTALRRSISNYTHFREEARQLMLNVYHRHEVGVHGMDKSLMSSLPAWPMITSEVLIWLNRIRRRMSANPKASNPWTIEVKRDLPQEIFEVLVKSVQGAPSAFGVSVEDNVIKYTKKNRLLRDFSKLCGIPQSEVANKLKKSFGGNRKDLDRIYHRLAWHEQAQHDQWSRWWDLLRWVTVVHWRDSTLVLRSEVAQDEYLPLQID